MAAPGAAEARGQDLRAETLAEQCLDAAVDADGRHGHTEWVLSLEAWNDTLVVPNLDYLKKKTWPAQHTPIVIQLR